MGHAFKSEKPSGGGVPFADFGEKLGDETRETRGQTERFLIVYGEDFGDRDFGDRRDVSRFLQQNPRARGYLRAPFASPLAFPLVLHVLAIPHSNG